MVFHGLAAIVVQEEKKKKALGSIHAPWMGAL
jgi:hypothetical protein